MGKLVRGISTCLLFAALLIPGINTSARETGLPGMLTQQERDYLQQDKLITVAFSPNKGPIQYRDKTGEQKGISKDVLEQVAALTGLRFSFVTVSGIEAMKEGLDSGQFQILAGIPLEREVQELYAVSFSKRYLNCAYGVLLPRGSSLDNREQLRLALTAGLDVPEEFQDVREITRFNTIQECIQAVSDGEADFTYGNAYVLEFYSQGYRFQNLSVVPFSGRQQQICFGVDEEEDPSLISILDKTIDYIGQDGFTNIIVRNVAVSTQKITLISLISMNPGISVCVGILIVGLVGLLAALLLSASRRKAAFLRIEHQRHLLLSEVAQEYFYEYNFLTDTMILTRDTAELFGTKEVFRRWLSVLRDTDKLEPSSRKMLEQLYTVCLESQQPNAGTVSRGMEVELPIASGVKRWFRLTRIVLSQHGRPAYSIGKLMDIEEEHKAYHDLIQKSVTDGMTGVYNAVAARELIDRAAQNLRAGILFMLDLDSFKQVNDQFGHQAGDQVIRDLAEILKRVFRKDDIIGRVGGDEFIVFAQNTSDRAFIEKKCRELQEEVGKIQIGEGFRQSASIGVAIMEPPCLYEQLFQQADAALYFVKNHGRAGYHIFS